MLLADTDLRIEGEQGTVLFEVYAAVALLLEENGHTKLEADHLALQLLPRLHNRLATAGCVIRQVETSTGRHADTS